MEIARLLVSSKADINKSQDDGITPLNIASYEGHVEIARLLVLSKADVNKAAVDGATPLDIASK